MTRKREFLTFVEPQKGQFIGDITPRQTVRQAELLRGKMQGAQSSCMEIQESGWQMYL